MVDDHDDVLIHATGVMPDALVHPQHRDPVEPGGVLDQPALALAQDGGVGGIPRDPEDLRHPVVTLGWSSTRARSAQSRGGAGQLGPCGCRPAGVFLPEPSTPGARVAADAQQQGGGAVPVGHMRRTAGDRAPRGAHGPAVGAPGVRFGGPALKGRSLSGEGVPGGSQTQGVKAGERGEVGCGEGTVGHVEVFCDGFGLATSIMGASTCVRGVRRAGGCWADGPGTATHSTAKSLVTNSI